MLRSCRNTVLFEPLQLPSNAGSASLTIEPLRAAREDDADGFDVTLALSYSRWRDAEQQPCIVRIERMWLAAIPLRALLAHLGGWLALPLAALDPRQLDGAFELGGTPGEELRIVFGDRADTIAEHKPVVTISFGAGTLRGEFHFVTDPSCLASFAESLKRLVLTAMA